MLRSSALDYNQMSSSERAEENENEKYSREITLVLIFLDPFYGAINTTA
jgi:hypothetical protein